MFACCICVYMHNDVYMYVLYVVCITRMYMYMFLVIIRTCISYICARMYFSS